MAQGSVARKPVGQQLVYLRKRITVADVNLVGLTAIFSVGWIPAGSILPFIGSTVGGGVAIAVSQVFNAGSTNTITLGVRGSPALYSSAISLEALGIVAANGVAGADHFFVADTEVVAQMAITGTAPTTGIVDVLAMYIPPDERPS